MRSPRQGLRVAVVCLTVASATAACSSAAQKGIDRHAYGTGNQLPEVPEPQQLPANEGGRNATPTSPDLELPQVAEVTVSHFQFDESINHAMASRFYQKSSLLSDLFANPASPSTSQLCWPTALAYQMSYQRQRASAPLSALPDTVVGADADAAAAASVRHFTKACDTDIKNDGTTAPQGVKCIDQTYRAAGYTPHISVLGNDSQWAAFGMFPDGTGIEERSVDLADLRTAMDADRSVILLIGFYRLSSDGKRWDRIKGHYISVAGYGYDRKEGNDDMTLIVVDPSIDYGTGKPFNAVTMRQRETSGVLTGLPENAAFDLTGETVSFGAIRTVVETAIVFDATRAN